MRFLIIATLLALMPLPTLAQRKLRVKPVKVVKLARKTPVSYEKDIEPIFYKRCIACHSGKILDSNFDISTYEKLVKGGKRGSPVVAGKSHKSFLYTTLTRTKRPYMPPRGEDPVTPEELALIKLWIDQGAKAPQGARVVKVKILPSPPPKTVTPVRAIALSPDKSAVAAGRGNHIHVYDAKTGAHIRDLVTPNLKTFDGRLVNAAHISLVESMAFSPDGKYLASGSFQEVNIWDIKTGTLRRKLEGFAHNVVAVTFSKDGKMLATGGGAPTADGEVKIFEVGSWNQVAELKNGHSDTVYGLCFSPDNKHIVTGSADKFVKVFEIPSMKFVKSFEGHANHVLDVGWTKDGKYLASAGADNAVKIWDYKKGEQRRTINAAGKQLTRLKFFGKNDYFVTCAGDGTLRIMRASNGGTVRSFSGNSDFIYAVDVSADQQVVVCGGQEGVIRIYNGQNGRLEKTLSAPAQVASTKKK
ncbi:MAG: c-type cytochrome domain-containing protein [Gemmataceae bacterium]